MSLSLTSGARDPQTRSELLARISAQLRMKKDGMWVAELARAKQEGSGYSSLAYQLLCNMWVRSGRACAAGQPCVPPLSTGAR